MAIFFEDSVIDLRFCTTCFASLVSIASIIIAVIAWQVSDTANVDVE